MNDADRQNLETRVLLLAPTAKDEELTCAILARAGISCVGCPDPVQLCQQLTAGAGAVLIAEEAVDSADPGLAGCLTEQAPWSDLPVLILAHAGASSALVAWAIENLGNVTVLERPTQVAALVSAVRTALRARQRQYQLRNQLIQRERVAEQLEMAMAAAHAGSWHLDLTTGEFNASDRAIELYGLPPGTPLDREQARACVHPDDRASIDAALQRTVETGQPFRHENRVLHPDGSFGWVLSHAERRSEGLHTCLVGHVQDVTARKQAELRLRASEEFNRSLMDGSSDCVKVLDMHGRLLSMNNPGQVLMEVEDFGPLSGIDWTTLWPAAGRDEVQRAVQCARDGGIYAFQAFCPTTKGTPRWWDVAVSPVQDASDGPVVRILSVSRDITERKRAELTLAERTALLNGVLEGTPDVVFVKDLNGHLLLANAAFAAAARSTPEQLVGKTDGDLFPPDVAAAVRRQDEAVIAGGLPMQFEETIPVAGEARSFLTLKAPLRDGSSRVVGILGIGRDITERKQAEEALRASGARLRRVFESNVIGMVRWDLDRSLILDANAEFFRMTGYTREDLTNGTLNLRTMTPPEWTERNEAGIRALRADGFAAAYEKEYFCKDGSRVPLIIAGTLFEDSPSEGMSFLVDITDRKRAEESLRDSEARLGGILRQSPAGIVQTDAAGCMTMVNPRWCEMLGHAEAELLGRSIIEITSPSFVASTAAAFGRLAAGGPDFQIEKAYSRKDGSVLCSQCNVAAIRSAAGKFLGAIAVVVDISERLRTEDELRRLAAELSEADRRKDVFLATLAHELRNPLAPIRNGLQVMKLKKNSGEAFEQVRAMMDRQLLQLVRLVDDLLDVSRITQGKVELRRERVALKAVIEAAVETSRPGIDQASHQLTIVIPDEPIFVDGDATRLAQVVSNLLNNSAKYTHRGGHVRLAAGLMDGMAIVSVKDNGIGIPPSMIGRVFEMFTQVDRTLEKSTGGLGIGLSLVKGLLEMHGGTIEAKSDGEGLGSEFLVRLPVVMSKVAEPGSEARQTGEVVPSVLRRILVVDDNVDSAESLGQLLELLGNEVRIANDGETAIEVAAQFRPDMVLMDIGMPKLNGYEAARLMREHPWGRSMMLVALTGWGHSDDRKRSADAGFNLHLVKPVEMEDLTKLMTLLRCADIEAVGTSVAALPCVVSAATDARAYRQPPAQGSPGNLEHFGKG